VKENGWVIRFKNNLHGVLRAQWYGLAERLNNVILSKENNKVLWKWSPSKAFSVKSVYEHQTQNDNGHAFKRVWKAKLPAKIKTFMWLVEQRAILAKDNLIKRQWHSDPNCYFCGTPETIDHLFFGCPIAKVVWGVLAICFQQSIRPTI
jgi:hypothetical protein